MEDSRQAKNTILTWSTIGIVFAVIIAILLAQYLDAGKRSAVKQANGSIESYVKTYSSVLYSKLDSISAVGKAIAELKDKGCDTETLELRKSLLSCEVADEVFVYRYNNKMLGSDFDAISLFKAAGSDGESSYTVGPASSGEGDSVYAYVPIDSGTGSVIFELNMRSLEKSFPVSSYENASFLAIITPTGDVLSEFGRFRDTDSMFLHEDNIFECCKEEMEDKQILSLNTKIISKNIFSEQLSHNGDVRTIAFSSIGKGDLCLAMGVRQSTVDKITDTFFDDVEGTVIRLGIVIFVFTIFVVSTVILSSIRTKERGRALEDKADTDLLTELNNKAATERKIQEYLDDNPNGRGLMFILDIDNFKKINDTMGHAFGDTLLKTLGKEIRAEFRMSDIIGRTGGDEFMVFLKDVTDDMIVVREANRITRFFQDFKAGGDYVKYSASASIGAAIYPDDAKTFKDLYVAADQALYKAKKRGKNQLCFYNEAARK